MHTRYDPEPAQRFWLALIQMQRVAADPGAALLEFLESTYVAAASTAHWDRSALERPD